MTTALSVRDTPWSGHRRVWIGIVVAALLTAACVVLVVGRGHDDLVKGTRLIGAFAVMVPFAVSLMLLTGLSTYRSGDFAIIEDRFSRGKTVPPDHVDVDESLWKEVREHCIASWIYERERMLSLQPSRYLKAMVFGSIATIGVTAGVLVLHWGDWAHSAQLGVAIAAATGASFLTGVFRILLRISSGDATCRTFAWATRSLVLVIMATIGLYALLISTDTVTTTNGALLLGVFVGTTGDPAFDLFEKLAKEKLGGKNTAATQVPGTASLYDIVGMTEEQVARLEEEGIGSIVDLAFVPTPRLFFATAYSLQQICDWQDQALLLVYLGKQRASALSKKMAIQGVIDLRGCVHDIKFGTDPEEKAHLRTTLKAALELDDGGFDQLAGSMMHDEATMRVRYYWRSAVAPAIALPDEDVRSTAAPYGALELHYH